MRNHTLKMLALAIGISLAVVALSPSAHAASLREGSTGSSSEVTGSLPGQVLWGYYQTEYTLNLFNSEGHKIKSGTVERDNILRLVNPNGAANSNLPSGNPQTVCAMIYVFDDDQEMGECCGCPLSSTQLATFSVDQNLTSNWGLQNGSEDGENAIGTIAVVATIPNGPGDTCVPTNIPGYTVTPSSNLLASISGERVTCRTRGSYSPLGFSGINLNFLTTGGPGQVRCFEDITETALSDDAGGDPTNLVYLQEQCGAIVGNGTGGGICNCPTEG